MIEYIKHEHNMTNIYQNNKIETIDHSVTYVIKRLCLDHLITYEGYVKAIQFKYHIHHLIPLVLSDEISLIPIMRVRDYDNIWVNSVAIKSIHLIENGLNITFMSGNTLQICKTMAVFKKALMLANTIKNVKVKHFHS